MASCAVSGNSLLAQPVGLRYCKNMAAREHRNEQQDKRAPQKIRKVCWEGVFLFPPSKNEKKAMKTEERGKRRKEMEIVERKSVNKDFTR